MSVVVEHRKAGTLNKIAVTNLILIIAFLVTGVVLSLAGQANEAHGALGTAAGLSIGTATAVGFVQRNQ